MVSTTTTTTTTTKHSSVSNKFSKFTTRSRWLAAVLVIVAVVAPSLCSAQQNYDLTPPIMHYIVGRYDNSHFGISVATGDFDNNGWPDLIIGASQDDSESNNFGAVYILENFAGGLDVGSTDTYSETREPVSYTNTPRFGRKVFTAYIDDDSYEDAVMCGPGTATVSVLYGSSSGLVTSPANNVDLLDAVDDDGYTIYTTAGMGWDIAFDDYDNDGNMDMVLGMPFYASGGGQAYWSNGGANLYEGRSNGAGIDETPILTWSSSYGTMSYQQFGSAVANGQFESTPRPDVVVCSQGSDRENVYYGLHKSGVCAMYEGTSSGVSTSRSWTYTPAIYGEGFGACARSIKIEPTDTYDTLVIGAPWSEYGAVYIFHANNGLPSTPDQIIYGTDQLGEFGLTIVDGGDINQDGYNDLVVAAPYGGLNLEGRVYVFFWDEDNQLFGPDPAYMLEGATQFSQFGLAVDAGSDMDGNGYPDLVVGAAFDYDTSSSTYNDRPGAVYVFATPQLVDLELTGDWDNTNYIASETAVLSLNLNNAGPETATTISVQTTLATGLSYQGYTFASGSCSAVGQVVTCTAASLAKDANFDITLDVLIPGDRVGTLVTAVTAWCDDQVDLDDTDNDLSKSFVSTAEADISFAAYEAVSAAPHVAGNTLVLRANLTNLVGPSSGLDVTANFTVPHTGFSLVLASASQGACQQWGTVITCAIGKIHLNAQVTVSMTFTMSNVLPATSYRWDAVLASPVDVVDGGDTTFVDVDTIQRADLAIGATVSPTTVIAGGFASYSILVTSTGPSLATNVQIDSVPTAGLTYFAYTSSKATCTPSGNDVNCVPNTGTMAKGGSITIVITYAVDASYISGESVGTTLTVGSDITDDNTGDNTATPSNVVSARANTYLDITANPSPIATIGQTVLYTVIITNGGLSDGTDISVSCDLPLKASYSYIASSESISNPSDGGPYSSSCSYSAGTVTCDLDYLADTYAANMQFGMLVESSATVGETAQVNCSASTTGVPDPDTSNNDISLTLTFDNSADLFLSMQRFPSTGDINAGAIVTLSVSLFNGGPSQAIGTNATIYYPDSQLTPLAPPSECSIVSPGVFTCQQASINYLSAYATSILFRVSPDTSTPVSVTAEGTALTPDGVPSNNFAAVNFNVSFLSSISAELLISATPVSVGQAVTYTTNVRNFGPSAAVNVVLTSLLDGADVTSVPAYCSSADAGTYSQVDCVIPYIAAGTTAAVAMDTTVKFGTETQTLVSNSTISAPRPDVTDADNFAVISTTVDASSSDLDLSISALPAAVLAGNSITYSVFVGNLGDDSNNNVRLFADFDESAVTITSATFRKGGPLLYCDVLTGNLTCSIGVVAKSETIVVTVVAAVGATYEGNIAFDASVSGDVDDPTNANNDVSVNTPATTRADLSVVFSAVGDIIASEMTAGSTITIAAQVTNNGPSTATNTLFRISLPTAGADVIHSIVAPVGCVISGWDLLCTPGVLAKGARADYIAKFDINATTAVNTPLTLSVNATNPAQGDIVLSNNYLETNYLTTVLADVSVVTTGTPATAALNQSVAIQVRVANNGPSQDTDVDVTCTLPAQAEFSMAGGSLTPGGLCSYTASLDRVDCSLGTVTLSSTSLINFVIDMAAPNGFATSLVVSCSVTTSEADPSPSNDASAVTVPVNPNSDILLIAQAVPSGTITRGKSFTFAYALINYGPSTAVNPWLTVTIPTGSSLISSPASCVAGSGTVSCTVASLDYGKSYAGSLVMRVASDAAASSLHYNFSSGALTEDDTSDNYAQFDIALGSSADMAINNVAVSSNPVRVGAAQTFTVDVSNYGPSQAENVVVTVNLDGVENVASAGCIITPQGPTGTQVTCNYATVNAGANFDVIITSTVRLGIENTTVPCSASVAASTTDPKGANDLVNFEFKVRSASSNLDLALSMVPVSTVVQAGNVATFTTTIGNLGPDANSDLVIDLDWTGDATIKTISTTKGSCAAGPGDASPVNCSVTALAKGATVQVTVGLLVADDYEAAWSFNAAVDGALTDTTPGNNAATQPLSSIIRVDLTALQTAAPLPVTAGKAVTLNFRVVNNGPSRATNGAVSALLSDEFVNLNMLTSGCIANGQRVTCAAAGDLTDGQEASFNIQATLSSATAASTVVSVETNVTSSETELTPADNRLYRTYVSATKTDVGMFIFGTPSPAPIGGTITYTMTVQNYGPSDSTGVYLNCTMPLYTGFSLSAAPTQTAGSCVQGYGSTFSCDMGAFAKDDVETASFAVSVVSDASFTGTATASCFVTSDFTDPVASNNDDTVGIPVDNAASLNLNLGVTPTGTVYAGQTISASYVVTNVGPSPALNVRISTVLPAGVTLFGNPPAVCVYNHPNVTCTHASLAVLSGSLSRTLNVKVDASYTLPSVTLKFDVVADNPGAFATQTAVRTVDTRTDLYVTLKQTVKEPGVGETVGFVVVLGNYGPSLATTANLLATFDGVEGGSVSVPGCNIITIPGLGVNATDYEQLTCNLDVAPLSAISIAVSATVQFGFSDSYIDADATATAFTPSDDPVASNNAASITTYVRPAETDLQLAMSASKTAAKAGEYLVYSLFVSNAGPDSDSNVILLMNNYPGLEIQSMTPTSGTCFVGLKRCNIASLAVLGSVRVDVSVRVTSTFAGETGLSASVAGTLDETNPANNDRVVNVTSTIDANVGIEMSVSPNNPVAGSLFYVVLRATNYGPSLATGTTVTFTPPGSGVVVSSATLTEGAGYCDAPTTPTAPFNCYATAGLDTSDYASFTLTLDVPANTTQSSMSLTSAVTAAQFDSKPSNDAVTTVYTVQRQVDAAVALDASPFPIAAAGSTVTYTLTIDNNGPSDADAGVMTVVVNFPSSAGLSLNAPVFDSDYVNCSLSTATQVTCDSVYMADGAETVVTMALDSLVTFSGSAPVTATATTTVLDPNVINDASNIAVTIDNTADLALNVQLFPNAAVYGGNVFTVPYTLLNGGPSTAVNPRVTLTLPTGISIYTMPPQCSVATGVLTCTSANLLSGVGASSGTIRFKVAGDAPGPAVLNFAAVADTIDVVPGNNNPSLAVTIDYLVDLDVTLDPSSSPVGVGQPQSYLCEVRNKGPSTAFGVWVAIELAGVAPGYTAPVVGNNGTCIETYSAGGGGRLSLNCSLGAIELYEIVPVLIDTTVSYGQEGKRFNMTATTGAVTHETVFTNNYYANAFDVRQTLANLDMAITSTPTVTAYAGAKVVFSVFTSNLGPDPTNNVVLNISWPNNAVVSTVNAGSKTCTWLPDVLSCDLGIMAISNTVAISMTATVESTYEGDVSIESWVKGDVPELPANLENNYENYTIGTVAEANLRFNALAVSSGTLLAGNNYDVVVVVSNWGPSPAASAVATIDVPPFTTLVSGTGQYAACTQTLATVTCPFGLFPSANSGSSITYVGSLTFSTTPSAYGLNTLSGSVSSPTTDVVPSNNFASTAFNLTQRTSDTYVTAVSPIPASVIQGEQFEFKFVVGNNGPYTCLSSVLDATIISGGAVDAVTFNISTGSCTWDAELETANCVLGDLATYASVDVSVFITSNAEYVGTFWWAFALTSSPEVAEINENNNYANTSTTVVIPETGEAAPNSREGEAAAITLSIFIVIIILVLLILAAWFLGLFKKWSPPEDGEEEEDEDVEEDDKPFMDDGDAAIANALFGDDVADAFADLDASGGIEMAPVSAPPTSAPLEAPPAVEPPPTEAPLFAPPAEVAPPPTGI